MDRCQLVLFDYTHSKRRFVPPQFGKNSGYESIPLLSKSSHENTQDIKNIRTSDRRTDRQKDRQTETDKSLYSKNLKNRF